MMSLTFGLFTQVSGSGPLGPLVSGSDKTRMLFFHKCPTVVGILKFKSRKKISCSAELSMKKFFF